MTHSWKPGDPIPESTPRPPAPPPPFGVRGCRCIAGGRVGEEGWLDGEPTWTRTSDCVYHGLIPRDRMATGQYRLVDLDPAEKAVARDPDAWKVVSAAQPELLAWIRARGVQAPDDTPTAQLEAIAKALADGNAPVVEPGCGCGLPAIPGTDGTQCRCGDGIRIATAPCERHPGASTIGGLCALCTCGLPAGHHLPQPAPVPYAGVDMGDVYAARKRRAPQLKKESSGSRIADAAHSWIRRVLRHRRG